MRKFTSFIALALLTTSGIASAGEVTGGPKHKPTGMVGHANSICAYSGQEDGITLVGFDANGFPIFINVEWGPGTVQTPHHENAAGIVHPPGIPGDACRGN